MSLEDFCHLKVPRPWAEKYGKIARSEGITGRAAWAIKARQVLKEGLDSHSGSLLEEGEEKEAALVEGTKPEAISAEGSG